MGEAERREAASDGPVLDLSAYVPGLFTFVANKLSRSASALYRREFGVNVTEWRVLAQLAIEPGITAARICQVIGFDKGPVSRTLAAMERAGLVASAGDPADSRRRLVRMTPAGRALHDRIIRVALERERRLLSCLEPEERRTLIGYLNRLHANLPAVTRPIAVERPVAGEAEREDPHLKPPPRAHGHAPSGRKPGRRPRRATPQTPSP